MGGNGDFAEKNTLHECAAIVIAKGFANYAMAVYGASDPGICSANHGKLGLRASENGILQVLGGTGTFEEPSVIGHHHKKLGALESKVAGEIAKGVFKANERSEFHGLGLHVEDFVFGARVEIRRHQIAHDLGEKRKFFAQRDVFAKGDEMDFVIELGLFSLNRKEGDGVEVAVLAPMHGAKKKVALVLLGETANQIPCHLMTEQGIWR